MLGHPCSHYQYELSFLTFHLFPSAMLTSLPSRHSLIDDRLSYQLPHAAHPKAILSQKPKAPTTWNYTDQSTSRHC